LEAEIRPQLSSLFVFIKWILQRQSFLNFVLKLKVGRYETFQLLICTGLSIYLRCFVLNKVHWHKRNSKHKQNALPEFDVYAMWTQMGCASWTNIGSACISNTEHGKQRLNILNAFIPCSIMLLLT